MPLLAGIFRLADNLVGAGLPAMREIHPANSLNFNPLSRASPLPQGYAKAKKAPKGAFFISASGKQALPCVARYIQSDNVRLSIAGGMLGPQLHGRLL